MDQRPFIELSKFDKTTVDLKKPPHTAEEYLRQAIVERESIPQVSNDVPSFNYMKSKEWTEGQIKLFMSQRVIFLQYIPERENLDDDSCNSSISLPKSYDEWINFCINNTTSSIELPSPSLLKEMNAKNLSDCIGSLTQYMKKIETLDDKIFHWLYLTLLAMPLPLSPDTTFLLRDLSKYCHTIRSKYIPGVNEKIPINNLSIIIAIIGNCYNQKDLADYKF